MRMCIRTTQIYKTMNAEIGILSYLNHSLSNIDCGKRSRVAGLEKGNISCDKNYSLDFPNQN